MFKLFGLFAGIAVLTVAVTIAITITVSIAIAVSVTVADGAAGHVVEDAAGQGDIPLIKTGDTFTKNSISISSHGLP